MTVVWHAAMTAAAVLLIASAVSHSRDWKLMLSSLLKHGVLPYKVARRLARMFASIEFLLALLVGSSVAFPGILPSYVAGGAAAVFFGSMTAYLAAVVVRRGEATCNCFGTDQPLNWMTVVRAALLMGAAVGYSFAGSATVSAARGQGFLIGIAVAAALVFLPNVRSGPARGVA
ncbi:MauE/DoxX family redox-associated membrane protein [Pimelobacter simplex]|uniref:MauE/DoxX family redox-associated membrane protein n=1 Tax=Nocardioides simplex TaxID=2045 RepID=UPI001932B1A7|nr:hypothetical protein [Pimelobacter simplex]